MARAMNGSGEAIEIKQWPSNGKAYVTKHQCIAASELRSLLSRPIAPRQIRTCLETPGFVENEFKEYFPEMAVRENEYRSETEHKNRYYNILPSPHTRVKLSSSDTTLSVDYINANFVRGHRETMAAYIATQGPLPHTIGDFWKMVWENGCDVIIMASDWSEGGIERSAKYLPENEGETVRFGECEIILTEFLKFKDYVSSIVTVRNTRNNESRQLRHYRITCWPIKGLPSSTEKITTLLRTIKSWQSSHPVVVHCASGAGRTGVILAIDVGLQSLLNKEPVIDVLRIVSTLKQDRLVLIQTPQQHRFVNKALADMVQDLGL